MNLTAPRPLSQLRRVFCLDSQVTYRTFQFGVSDLTEYNKPHGQEERQQRGGCQRGFCGFIEYGQAPPNRHASRHLVMNAMKVALRQRDTPTMHHSDRGPQYSSDDFRELLYTHRIECRMNGTGSCYDNAPVESFSLCSSESVYGDGPSQREKKRKLMCSTTSNAFIIDGVVMLRWIM